jgi:hypothetical protein
MRKNVNLLLILLGFWQAVHSQVAINSTGTNPDASAGLDVSFTDKGLLIPRVALTQTTSPSPITSPATSLLVYNTATINDVTPGYYYWDGTKWVKIGLANHIHATLTFNNSGSGAASGSTYNGSSPLTISYNTIGAVGGNGTATQVAFWSDSNTLSSNSNLYWDNTNNRLGIGTTSPTAKLHVNGTFRLTDGTEGAGKVLTSDASGNASWQTPSASLNINWINPVVIFSGSDVHNLPGSDSYPNNTTDYDWQTIDISSYVPAGTKNVLVEVDYNIAGPDNGDVDAFLLVRADSSAPTIPIARGRSAGWSDDVAGLNTAIIPIDQSTRTFQLAIEQPGFSVTVRLLAYF